MELRDHGIVESRRGRYGGHRLARAPDRKTQFSPCADCLDLDLCVLRPIPREARDAIAAVLDRYSLAELVRDGQRVRDHLQSHRMWAGKCDDLGSKR